MKAQIQLQNEKMSFYLLFQKTLEILLKRIRNIYYRKGKIISNKIFFMTYDCSYSCNPKAICEEIIRRNLNVELIWVSQNDIEISKNEYPPNVKLVTKKSKKMFDEQASSKIWIDNAFNCIWYGMPKKDNQIYINTWHGSMGIKKLTGNHYWLKCAKKSNKITDYCITNSDFEERVFNETFWKGVRKLRYGHPRNDVLFKNDQFADIVIKTKKKLNIDKNYKICLYAPTFRDYSFSPINDIDFEVIKETLTTKYGGKWKIVIRLHSKERQSYNNKKKSDLIVDGSEIPDIYDLMIASDVGVTDYSSWAFDYIFLKKPLFIYAPDLEEYKKNRGLYYDINETPFLIAIDQKEFIKNIYLFNQEKYEERINNFLLKMGCYEEGEASKRIVDFIEEIIK